LALSHLRILHLALSPLVINNYTYFERVSNQILTSCTSFPWFPQIRHLEADPAQPNRRFGAQFNSCLKAVQNFPKYVHHQGGSNSRMSAVDHFLGNLAVVIIPYWVCSAVQTYLVFSQH
jgi:hypothetical protein